MRMGMEHWSRRVAMLDSVFELHAARWSVANGRLRCWWAVSMGVSVTLPDARETCGPMEQGSCKTAMEVATNEQNKCRYKWTDAHREST